jgi:hypothetical protein
MCASLSQFAYALDTSHRAADIFGRPLNSYTSPTCGPQSGKNQDCNNGEKP